ncbi:MAG TPA: PA14 domain-containing protein [Ilumatobacteraceae bacterium]|nr:PA14 domain-containing protein [Ilumatobacteraceae bacterium]
MITVCTQRDRRTNRDSGMALPMVLVLTAAIGLIVISLTTFATANLSYGRVTENRSDRLSAADAGLRYAIDQLRLRNAGCILDTQKAVLPGVQADFNGATASVTCERITSGFDGIQAYAAVMTGEGLPATTSLLSSQSGSNAKILGGPVFMSRLDNAFSLGPPVNIKDGPLLYFDTTATRPCRSVKASTIPSALVFDPKLIFGPVCVSEPWTKLFDSPEVPNLSGLVERNGTLGLASSPALPAAQGSFTDHSGSGGCRVFEPGRYTTPPALTGVDAYFKTGDYVFDFPTANPVLTVRQGVVTAGRINPRTTTVNEIPTSTRCRQQQTADPAPADQYGATFYFAGPSRINVATQGSLEIHTRQQGPADYVSVQTLCAPNSTWCNASGGGFLTAPKPSTMRAPAADSSDVFLYTDSGNNKEFVAHGLVYAPLTQVEFGNVSNTATQRMLGGLVVSRLVLQSSTSATNFEISVPTSPITARIQLTSTATKAGETSIRAVVEYRPYEANIEDRVRVNSWRVCETSSCIPIEAPIPTTTTTTTTTTMPPTTTSTTPPTTTTTTATTTTTTTPPTTTTTTTPPTTTTTPPACSGGAATWTGSYFANKTLSSNPVLTDAKSELSYDWGSGSPGTSVPVDGFSARWTRTVDLPAAGTYRFTVGTDDGQRFSVNRSLVIDDWNIQSIGPGTNTIDVVITDPCNVMLQLEYYENTGVAAAFVTWTKIA